MREIQLTSSLFNAVRNESIDTIDLHALKDNLNLINEFGQNLLHEAIAHGNDEVGMTLIELGIDLNHQDSKGQGPLHYAAARNQLQIVEKILSQGGDVAVIDSFGNQPLWTAVFNARGDYRTVSALLICGAEPAHRNKAGRSPRDFAQQIQDHALTELLNAY